MLINCLSSHSAFHSGSRVTTTIFPDIYERDKAEKISSESVKEVFTWCISSTRTPFCGLTVQGYKTKSTGT